MRYWLWAIPKGKTDRLDEKPLTSFALTKEQAEKVAKEAEADGWHSFRLVIDSGEMPDFGKGINSH